MSTRVLLLLAALTASLLTPSAVAQPAQPAAGGATCAGLLRAKVKLNKASAAGVQCLPGVTRAVAKDSVINRPTKDAQDVQSKSEVIGRQLWRQMGR